MQKVIGSIIVIVTCTAFGFEKSKEIQLHLDSLGELKKLFTLLRSEIQYTKAPFEEVFLKLSKKTSGIYREWLIYISQKLQKREEESLHEVWITAIYKYLGDCKLTKDELEELCNVGKTLGYIETMDLYLTQLDFSIETTREELKSKKKLYQSMGIMCGIFLVIVLL